MTNRPSLTGEIVHRGFADLWSAGARTMAAAVVLASSGAIACSSTNTVASPEVKDAGPAADDAAADAAPAPPKCVARSGVYQYMDSLVSGTCGPASAPTSFSIADSTQAFAMAFVIGERVGAGKSGKVADYVKACSGSVTVSADNCGIEYSITCPQVNAPGTYQKVGTIAWGPDGKSATERQDYAEFAAGGAQNCAGKYAPTISK